jgi:hypothetical protein
VHRRSTKRGVKGNVGGRFFTERAALDVSPALAVRARRGALARRSPRQAVEGRGDAARVEQLADVDLAISLPPRLRGARILLSEGRVVDLPVGLVLPLS